MKDQSKKVASLKHKEQVEKSKNARLVEEARKREDNMSETSQHVKVRLNEFSYAFTALLAESLTSCNLTNSELWF